MTERTSRFRNGNCGRQYQILVRYHTRVTLGYTRLAVKIGRVNENGNELRTYLLTLRWRRHAFYTSRCYASLIRYNSEWRYRIDNFKICGYDFPQITNGYQINYARSF